MEITTNGEYKNVKFSTIKPGTSVQVNKIYEGGKEITTKFGPSFVVGLEYQGEQVSTFMTPAAHARWAELPLGSVKVTHDSKQAEFKGKDGKPIKKWISVYEFEAVEGDSSSPSSLNTIVLSTKQLLVLKSYVEKNWTPSQQINMTNDDGHIEQVTVGDFLPAEALEHPEMFLQ